MLAERLTKVKDSFEAMESHMRTSKSAKSIGTAQRQGNYRFSIDGANQETILTKYSFTMNKSTNPDIMGMDEIAAYENTDNPKEAIKRLVEEAK